MRNLCGSLLLLSLFNLASCSTQSGGELDIDSFQAPVTQGAVSSADYRTTVGDTLDVFVLEDSSFNGKYVIRSSGDIIIPKLGRVPVVSMSLTEVEKAVQRQLEASQLKKATVIADPVLRGSDTGQTVLSGITIYLSGSVSKSGRVFVPFVAGSEITAFQAIMDAGGFSSFANKKKSFLLRKDGYGVTKRVALDFTKIEAGKSADVVLRDGDMLVVPQKMFGL